MRRAQKTSLLRPPKQRQVMYQQKMTAKDERKIIGAFAMLGGVVLILIGLAVTSNEYATLPIEKLALMTIAEALGQGIGTTFVGFILFAIGLGVYLADSNKQAWRRAKGVLPI
jgi:hypothetical protein